MKIEFEITGEMLTNSNTITTTVKNFLSNQCEIMVTQGKSIESGLILARHQVEGLLFLDQKYRVTIEKIIPEKK